MYRLLYCTFIIFFSPFINKLIRLVRGLLLMLLRFRIPCSTRFVESFMCGCYLKPYLLSFFKLSNTSCIINFKLIILLLSYHTVIHSTYSSIVFTILFIKALRLLSSFTDSMGKPSMHVLYLLPL